MREMPSLAPSFSTPSTNRQVLLINRPVGVPQSTDFRIAEARLDPLPDGHFRVRNIFLSVDPAQRGWASSETNYVSPVALNTPMRALAVGVVVESRNPSFPIDKFVYGWFDWQDYATAKPHHVLTHTTQLIAPLSAYAGILGINGLTAYLSLTKFGRSRPGEVILVSTAAGAVGSVVGQIARFNGLKTLGLTGSSVKAERIVQRFGFDVGVNYKDPLWEDKVNAAAPDGIDIFFDNVGGAVLDGVIRRMRRNGRVVQSGTASVANWSPTPAGLRNEREIVTRRLNWHGFVIFDHIAEFSDAIESLGSMIEMGALVYDEDIDRGIEAAPGALSSLYAGENHGKKLVWIG